MPYTFNDPPDVIKNLPSGAQKVWIIAFNTAFDEGNDEETCIKIAWGAVKRIWKKVDGKWIRKQSEEVIMLEDKLPKELQIIWEEEYARALKAGNNELTAEKLAWLKVRDSWQKTQKGWVQKRNEEMMENFRILKENTPIEYKNNRVYKDHDIVDLQFCCIGENITEKELDEMIENFKSNALGQSIGLHVDHPFFIDIQSDKRRYGDIIDIYRKGSHEGWIKVELNPLGAEVFNNRSYAYLSPGWWGKYKHAKTGESVKNVAFEISMTNMPAEKLMNPIVNEAKPEDEETIDSLFEKLSDISSKITTILKHKSGNALLRAKFRDLLSSLHGKLTKSETMAEGELDKARKAQLARSKKYGIGIKDGGNVTKPSEYENIPDSDFLDPVNYRYPCDESHVMAGYKYWSKPENRKQYTPEEQKIMWKRLITKLPSKVDIDEIKKRYLQEVNSNNKKEEINMAENSEKVGNDLKKLTELEEKVKTLQEEKSKAEEIRKLAEERIAKLEKERRHDSLMKLTEKYLPKQNGDEIEMRMNTENQAKMVSLMETMSDEQVKKLTEIIDSMPAVKLNAKEKGVSGIMESETAKPKKLTEDEISMRAMELAKADPKWKNKAERENLYQSNFAKIMAEMNK